MNAQPDSQMPELPKRDASHLYKLQCHPQYGFWTGVTKDNEQVLLGTWDPELIAVFFSTQGDFLRLQRTPLDSQPRLFGGHVLDTNGNKWEEPDLLFFMTEIGYRSQTIVVRRFFVSTVSEETAADSPWDRSGVGIEDLPWHYQEVLNTFNSHSENEKNEFLGEIREWLIRGDFVFWWAADYDVNQEGEVVAS